MTVLAFAIAAALVGIAQPRSAHAGTSPFTDIAGTTFEADIDWLWAEGITVGCSATLYCPNDAVTRGQMASFIVRMFGLTEGGEIDAFTDDDGTTHETAINRLRYAGITNGCTATTFCPKRDVRRDEMASFLARAVPLTAGAGDNYFRDDDGTTHEANIDRLAAAGIASGCAVWKYCPAAGVTRGQMAAFLHRVEAPISPPPHPAPVGPQTLYVRVAGVDAGNGCTNSAMPCRTIRYAISTALSGETISVGPGTFAETSWTIDISLLITGDPGQGTIIDATCGQYEGLLDVPKGATLRLTDLTITGCDSAYRTLIANSGTLELIDVSLTGNVGMQGAIYNLGNLSIDGSKLTDNHASYGGGAIFNRGSTTIEDSVIEGNSSDGNGGGIVTVGSGNAGVGAELRVIRSTIRDNTSASRGGGIMGSSIGTVEVISSTVEGNTAANGSGIYNWSGHDLTVVNSTLAGNMATQVGGGIYNLTGNATITNSTISDNSAPEAGAVFHRNPFGSSSLTLRNALIAGNPTTTGAELRGVITTKLASIVGVPSGLALADLLDPAGLADNGGPTETIALTDSAANPALDAGHASTCAAAPVGGVDQRGVPRAAPCDIGAFELQP